MGDYFLYHVEARLIWLIKMRTGDCYLDILNETYIEITDIPTGGILDLSSRIQAPA